MDISTGTASGLAAASAEQANAMHKGIAGAHLINKTLENLNTTGTGAAVNQDFQFQKEVLSAAGIGNKLDSLV